MQWGNERISLRAMKGMNEQSSKERTKERMKQQGTKEGMTGRHVVSRTAFVICNYSHSSVRAAGTLLVTAIQAFAASGKETA